MNNRKKSDHKHLTLSQRIAIEKGLENQESFAAIARKINKDPSTVSKEVKRHLSYGRKQDGTRAIPCANRSSCRIQSLCESSCLLLCKICRKPGFQCTSVCGHYLESECAKLKKPPYACNGCVKKTGCLLRRSYYSAQYANDSYLELLVSSREGINQAPVDISILDALISPLLKKGQSLAHIYTNHAREIPCCRKTLYNYIDQGLFAAKNIDMRRRVRYKVRKKPTRVSLIVREFRIGRSYEEFGKRVKEEAGLAVVEMDTVIGKRNGGGKVLLTMFFRNCSLMLIFLMEEKSQEEVAKVFDWLSKGLGTKRFRELFPVILTDNGTEFQNPEGLEKTPAGKERTKLYYCNPNSSWQKGMIEKNHEYIRLVIPGGLSMDDYEKKDMLRLMNHINSEARDSLNGCTPFRLSKMLLNNTLHQVMKLEEIAPDEVELRPELLK